MQVAGSFESIGAACAFVSLLFLRHQAAGIYALAAPRAASSRFAGMWTGHKAQLVDPRGRPPSRVISAVWFTIACIIWFGLPALIVVGQFMNYEPALWLTHPLFLLPWAG